MARFDEKLVLNRWMLSHFDAQSIEDFDYLKDKRLEAVDENGQSRFFQTLSARLFDNPKLPKVKTRSVRCQYRTPYRSAQP